VSSNDRQASNRIFSDFDLIVTVLRDSNYTLELDQISFSLLLLQMLHTGDVLRVGRGAVVHGDIFDMAS